MITTALVLAIPAPTGGMIPLGYVAPADAQLLALNANGELPVGGMMYELQGSLHEDGTFLYVDPSTRAEVSIRPFVLAEWDAQRDDDDAVIASLPKEFRDRYHGADWKPEADRKAQRAADIAEAQARKEAERVAREEAIAAAAAAQEAKDRALIDQAKAEILAEIEAAKETP